MLLSLLWPYFFGEHDVPVTVTFDCYIKLIINFLLPELQRMSYGSSRTEQLPTPTLQGPQWGFLGRFFRNRSFHVLVICPGHLVLQTEVFVISSFGSFCVYENKPSNWKILKIPFTLKFEELTDNIVARCYEPLLKQTWN